MLGFTRTGDHDWIPTHGFLRLSWRNQVLKLLMPVIRTGLLACVGFCLATFPGKAFQISPGAASEEVFEVRAGFNGIDFTRASAADPHLAVGPSSLVLVANWSIVMRNKDGSLLAARTLDDFFGPTQVDDQRTKLGGFDSRAYFDRTTQRFPRDRLR